MFQLTNDDLMWSGGEITIAVLLGYVAVSAGIAAIVKIITSSRENQYSWS